LNLSTTVSEGANDSSAKVLCQNVNEVLLCQLYGSLSSHLTTRKYFSPQLRLKYLAHGVDLGSSPNTLGYVKLLHTDLNWRLLVNWGQRGGGYDFYYHRYVLLYFGTNQRSLNIESLCWLFTDARDAIDKAQCIPDIFHSAWCCIHDVRRLIYCVILGALLWKGSTRKQKS
jgi:hypothetical protein